jgi:hypothetical protein
MVSFLSLFSIFLIGCQILNIGEMHELKTSQILIFMKTLPNPSKSIFNEPAAWLQQIFSEIFFGRFYIC